MLVHNILERKSNNIIMISYNTSTTTYLNSVCQQLQEITQLTTLEALINTATSKLATTELSTTNQTQCIYTWYNTAFSM